MKASLPSSQLQDEDETYIYVANNEYIDADQFYAELSPNVSSYVVICSYNKLKFYKIQIRSRQLVFLH